MANGTSPREIGQELVNDGPRKSNLPLDSLEGQDASSFQTLGAELSKT